MHLRQRPIHHDIAVDVADAPITHRNQPASSRANCIRLFLCTRLHVFAHWTKGIEY